MLPVKQLGIGDALRCGLNCFDKRQTVFASHLPVDAEGGAYLICETTQTINELNLAPTTKTAINGNNLMRLLNPVFK